MPARPPIYGFDLITETLGDTVDPAVHRIRSVAVDTGGDIELLDGGEADLLRDLDDLLASLPPGVIATWNGSLLDLPLIAHRAGECGLNLALITRIDRRSAPPSPILDLDHAVCGAWGAHQHLDLRRVYAAVSRWRKRGRLDPESLIPPADELAARDPLKDARLARRLTERRWNQAKKYVDRMPERAGAPIMTVGDDQRVEPLMAEGQGRVGQPPRRRRSDR